MTGGCSARALYQEAAERAARTLAQPRVQSGTFAFFDTRPFLRTGEDAGDLLLRCARRGVVMTRGDACGADHAAWARLCFTAVPPDQLNAAMDILAEELRPQ